MKSILLLYISVSTDIYKEKNAELKVNNNSNGGQ